MSDIAKELGLSVASISYALKEPPSPKLSPKTRERILAALKKHNYVLDESARRVYTKRTDTVAMLVPDFFLNNADADRNLIQCLYGAQTELARSGFDMLVVTATEDFIRNAKWKRLLSGGVADGVILWGMTGIEPYLEDMESSSSPVVTIQSRYGSTISVTSDDRKGTFIMAEKAIEAGHRKFSVIPPSLTAYSGEESYNGFLEALSKHGISSFFKTEASGYGFGEGEAGAREIIERASDATCLITFSSRTAMGAIGVFESQGISVPRDISVTGVNDSYANGRHDPSCWILPSKELGSHGARLMVRLLKGERNLTSEMIPVHFHAGNTLIKLSENKTKRRK